MLELLDPVDHGLRSRRIEIEALRLGLRQDGGPAGELADDDTRPVAHDVRVDVLVGIGSARQRRGVEPRFVGERRRAHVGEMRIEREIDDLGHVM